MKQKQVHVRTYINTYSNPTKNLDSYLRDGWIVKHIIINNAYKDIQADYILEYPEELDFEEVEALYNKMLKNKGGKIKCLEQQ